MNPNPPQFRRFGDKLWVSQDGKRIAFTIECEDAAGRFQSGDISCAVDEIEDIMAYVAGAAVIASEKQESPPPEPKVGEPGRPGNPIRAQAMGLAAGRIPEESFVVVYLAGGLQLTFSVPSSGLARLLPGLAQTATTLSATKPQ